MTTFLRLLGDKDKEKALKAVINAQGSATNDGRCFEVDPDSFRQIPGAPFAYWVSDAVRQTFQRLQAFESEGRTVKQGLATADDFGFVRAWWKVNSGQWSVVSLLASAHFSQPLMNSLPKLKIAEDDAA